LLHLEPCGAGVTGRWQGAADDHLQGVADGKPAWGGVIITGVTAESRDAEEESTVVVGSGFQTRLRTMITRAI